MPPVVSTALVAVLLLAVLAVPRASASTYAYGLAFGSANAIAAMGIVLLYRSSRIVNFAQISLGAFSAKLFEQLVQHGSFAYLADTSCSGCLHGIGWVPAANYWLAAISAILVAPVVAALVYLIFVRRFASAPPLVATVLTVALAVLLGYLGSGQSPLLLLFNPNGAPPPVVGLGANLTPPVHLAITVPGGALLGAGHILLIGFALLSLGGLLAFLRFTRMGVAVRAVAEDPERASSLGIPDLVVQLTVWTLAGLLAGCAAVFASMAAGALSGGEASGATMTKVLAAGVLGNMQSLPLAVLASIGFSSLGQAFLVAYSKASIIDAVTFGAILVALLVRSQGRRRRYDPGEVAWSAARDVPPTPRALTGLPVVRRAWIGMALASVAVLIALPWALPPGATDNLTVYAVYAMVALSLLLVAGWAGQISLGQFAFAACGAFVAAVLTSRYHAPFPLAVLGGALSGAVLAVVVGLPALRLRGLYLAVTSLAFAVATSDVLLSPDLGGKILPDTLARPQLLGLDGEDEKTFYYFILLLLTLCTLAVIGLRRSRSGRAVIASRDNDRAAESFGIGVLRARLEMFAVSGFIAAAAGALFAFLEHGVRIGSYGAEQSEQMLLVLVLGGTGAVIGPLLGATFMAISGSVNTVGAALGPSAAVLLLLYVAPGGMTQVVFAVRDVFLRRVAQRYRIEVPSLVGVRGRESGERLPIIPKQRRGGGLAFVDSRYRLPGDPRLRPVPTERGVR
jgi:branched-chain amino acid transport system permease protein